MINKNLAWLFPALLLAPLALAEHRLKSGEVVPEKYFDAKSPSGLNLEEIYKVFELNLHDPVVEAVARIAQSNEKIKELIEAKPKSTNEISLKRAESELLYVKKYREKFVNILSEVGLKPEQVANVGSPPSNVRGALRGNALRIPKYLYQGEPIPADLLNHNDPSGLNFPAIKADQSRRRAAGESNHFSFTIVAYANSKVTLDAARAKENQAQPKAKTPADPKQLALEMAIQSNLKAMRVYGLTPEEIKAIPAFNDPRWGK